MIVYKLLNDENYTIVEKTVHMCCILKQVYSSFQKLV